LPLTEESSIAKGIRRIVGLTGEAALSAQSAAVALRDQLAQLEAHINTDKQQLLSIDAQVLQLLVIIHGLVKIEFCYHRRHEVM
jgi:alanyl-tRNA synthetase